MNATAAALRSVEERRLRQFLRHERLTVAMALAENVHHSRQKVEGGEHDGLRAQKTARATGARPGVLEEPEPEGESHGRVRGCPGAVAGRAAAGRRGRGSGGVLLAPVPHGRRFEAEGGGGAEEGDGGEEEAGAGGGGGGAQPTGLSRLAADQG